MLLSGIEALVAQNTGHSLLRSVETNQPNIVIRGTHLTKVEVWAVPSGTGITSDEYVLSGSAKRTNAIGSNEVWRFPIPSCGDNSPLVAAKVFVKAFDTTGKPLHTKSLPYEGVSAVYEAFCPRK